MDSIENIFKEEYGETINQELKDLAKKYRFNLNGRKIKFNDVGITNLCLFLESFGYEIRKIEEHD